MRLATESDFAKISNHNDGWHRVRDAEDERITKHYGPISGGSANSRDTEAATEDRLQPWIR